MCVRSFANGTNGMPMPSEVSPLADIGFHWYQCYANVYQWLSMVFTIGSLFCNFTNGPNDVIFKMTINENDEQIGAEIKEMTTIFSISLGANTSFSKFKKRFFILPQLSKFHIYCILLIFTELPS